MKYSQLALTTFAAVFLAACGGSGNNDMAKDNQNQNPQPTPPSNQQPSPPLIKQPSPSTPGTVAPSISGNYIKVDGKENHSTSRYRIDTKNSNIDWLFINGRPYYLRPSEKANTNFVTIKNLVDGRNEDISASNHLSYSSYGIVRDNINKQKYLFAQGVPTPPEIIPDNGGAYYQGHVLHGAINGDTVSEGKAIFAIDFSIKKLTGQIKASGEIFHLEANLRKDATFGGLSRAGTAVQGSLFGPNADELSGTYLNTEQNFHGSFGASKTDKKPSL